MALRADAVTVDLADGVYTLWLDANTSIQVTAQEARAELRGQARNDPDAIAAIATDFLNRRIKIYQPIGDLPGDDPDLITDPDRYPSLFWADADEEPVVISGQPVAFLASGPPVQIAITWDGATYVIRQRVT